MYNALLLLFLSSRPTEGDFRELCRRCTFILDTNSLLNLYPYPAAPRDDLSAFLEQHADRVWISFQVALEFRKGRLGVIAEQIDRFGQARVVLKSFPG